MSVLTEREKREIRAGNRLIYKHESESMLKVHDAIEAGYRIIAKTLGKEWADKNISPEEPPNSWDFMRRSLETEQDRLEHVDRVVQLAEFIHSLWFVPYFQDKIKDLRTKPLEETFFELRIAKSLLSSGHLVRFVVSTGIKKNDYDLIAQIDNQEICVEIKCKIGEPSYSEKRLLNPLKNAASQLPKDKPGIVFLKIHPNWTYQEETTSSLERVVNNYLERVA